MSTKTHSTDRAVRSRARQVAALTSLPAVVAILVALSPPALGQRARAAAEPGNGKNPRAVAEVLAGKRSTANAAWWGFDEEDSTATLQAAFDSGAKKVVIPKMGKDWMVEPLFLNKDNQEIFFEPGVVLMAKKGSFRGPNDTMISATDRSNIILRGYGATLRMRKKDYQSPPYRRAEWRSGIVLRGCRNVQILGLTIKETGGDGIYLGSPYSKDVIIRDVVSDGNHRQGLSVISAENLLVENSIFRNTRGTAPMAGIDLEPNKPGEKLVNIHIRNCLLENNDQLGMHMWLGKLTSESEDVSVLWESNVVRGGDVGIHMTGIGEDGPKGLIEFRNNIVEDTRQAGILIRSKEAASPIRVVFDSTLLINAANFDEPYDLEAINFYRKQYGIQYPSQWWRHATHWWRNYPSAPIVLRASGKASFGGLEFKNCSVVEDKDIPIVVVDGSGNPHGDGDAPGWRDISGNITAANPFGARIDVRTRIKNFTLKLNGRGVQP